MGAAPVVLPSRDSDDSVVVVVWPLRVVVVVLVVLLVLVDWPLRLLALDEEVMLDDWLELSLLRLDWLDWFDELDLSVRLDGPPALFTGDVGILPPICASIFCTHASISAIVIGPLGACTPLLGLPLELPPLEELCRLEEELVELLAVALPPGVLLVLVEDWLELVVCGWAGGAAAAAMVAAMVVANVAVRTRLVTMVHLLRRMGRHQGEMRDPRCPVIRNPAKRERA